MAHNPFTTPTAGIDLIALDPDNLEISTMAKEVAGIHNPNAIREWQVNEEKKRIAEPITMAVGQQKSGKARLEHEIKTLPHRMCDTT